VNSGRVVVAPPYMNRHQRRAWVAMSLREYDAEANELALVAQKQADRAERRAA
jgi:hypothetical protein